MGQIQDAQLQFEVACDYDGCVASGLPLCSPKFVGLPPHLNCCIKDSNKIR